MASIRNKLLTLKWLSLSWRLFNRVAFALLLMSNLRQKNLQVGNDVSDVDQLKQQYPHLEAVALSKYSYGDVEMILSQDVFDLIRTLKYFESLKKYSNCRPITVGLGFEWTSAFDFGTRLDLLQSCHPKWEWLQVGRSTSELVRNGVFCCNETSRPALCCRC